MRAAGRAVGSWRVGGVGAGLGLSRQLVRPALAGRRLMATAASGVPEAPTKEEAPATSSLITPRTRQVSATESHEVALAQTGWRQTMLKLTGCAEPPPSVYAVVECVGSDPAWLGRTRQLSMAFLPRSQVLLRGQCADESVADIVRPHSHRSVSGQSAGDLTPVVLASDCAGTKHALRKPGQRRCVRRAGYRTTSPRASTYWCYTCGYAWSACGRRVTPARTFHK